MEDAPWPLASMVRGKGVVSTYRVSPVAGARSVWEPFEETGVIRIESMQSSWSLGMQ